MQCRVWNHAHKLFTLCYTNGSSACLALWMDPSSTHAWLCNTMCWSSGKQCFTEFQHIFLTVASSLYTIYQKKKCTAGNVAADLQRKKSLSIGQLAGLPWPTPGFQVFAWNFSCFETLSFYRWQQTASVVLLEVMRSLCSFSRKRLSNTHHPLKYKWHSVKKKKNRNAGTSLVVHWLRLHVSNAGDVGSIPGQGTKVPHATVLAKRLKKRNKNRNAYKCFPSGHTDY